MFTPIPGVVLGEVLTLVEETQAICQQQTRKLVLAHFVFQYIFSLETRAQHLTLSVWCLCGVWCPLDGCVALIGQ